MRCLSALEGRPRGLPRKCKPLEMGDRRELSPSPLVFIKAPWGAGV